MESKKLKIQRLNDNLQLSVDDEIAVEEVLQIKVKSSKDLEYKSLVMTMRTPGHDTELALGFLNSEGLMKERSDVLGLEVFKNEIRINLASAEHLELDNRNTFSNSSCGVCSKEDIEDLKFSPHWEIKKGQHISAKVLISLPEKLRATQEVFEKTGGLHASALFSLDGEMIKMREDIGRHNALDKLIGWSIQSNQLPLSESILLLSGRISYELVQKAIMGGVSIIAAIGAPSSLAVETAEKYGLTLIGFLKKGNGNIYCGAERVVEHSFLKAQVK